TEPTTTGTEAEDILHGDANGDGAVNMKDVLILRKFLAGIDVSYVARNSDVNGDGNVNMKDVLILRKFLAGIITVIDPTA
ncbi:MAG: dockerin type I repeat-containing protein, partial [Clostridia bacterium]|nr:dockerin type I repeat-containing protein [Clostridia bacterium]